MGASGREFMLMRQNEEGEMYVPSLSKKEVQAKAKEDVQSLLDAGQVDTVSAFVDVARVTEYITVFGKELRKSISEAEYGKGYVSKGAKLDFSSTGDRLDYEQDKMYSDLKEKLKAREDLLKLAYKSKDSIYDNEGVEVMKVGIKTFGSEVVKLTF